MTSSAHLATFTLAVSVGLFLMGCNPRADRYLDGIERDPKPSNAPIDIYYTGQAPTRPYKPIILLRVSANNGPDLIAIIRRECRKYGADAAVFQNVRGSESNGGGFGLSNGVSMSSTSSKDVVECLGILYTDHQ